MFGSTSYPTLPGFFDAPDWASLGLVASIVGCFLIANAILFEHPRRLVERYFGNSSGRLRSVREYIYNRVQTNLGFTFLLGGFGLQLFGRYGEVGEQGAASFSMAWVGAIVVLAVGLLFSGWWWSMLAFRRYVRQYFRQHPPNLEGDPATMRELGELFSVESFDDDTVEAYVARLRAKAGLPGDPRELRAQPQESIDIAVGEVELEEPA
ncbi:MAG: hypothetical protein E2O39_03645 [Planctomycetota bacterium]|nr:MAG: hypothetical protein E2O39_03645 [Planctomycetota bacterium]